MDETPPAGMLAANIMHFGRVLRAAGLPIGSGHIIQALRAVEIAGVRRRDDVYAALRAVLIHRRDQRELFDQAFTAFWRNPRILERLIGMLLQEMGVPGAEPSGTEVGRRLADALAQGRGGTEQQEEVIELDAALTASDRDVLQKRDFETMTAAEVAAAKGAIDRLALPLATVPTRRMAPAAAGARVDMRATLRATLRAGGDVIPLRHRKRRVRPPPLVVLCDISGSMGRYSRMLLHFAHALTNDRDRVHSFVFGTRLTNITRQLRNKDVDVALDAVVDAVDDWSGGTRIGACLRAFNQDWSRRVLGQGAVVLLISDGLDREAGDGLAAEMDRLHRSARRLIWLNPLLRYEGFAPKSLGIRAMLPHVDEFRPIHNLDSIAALAEALSGTGDKGNVLHEMRHHDG